MAVWLKLICLNQASQSSRPTQRSITPSKVANHNSLSLLVIKSQSVCHIESAGNSAAPWRI